MYQYLTPSTLEEMYKDLDEARLSILGEINETNKQSKMTEYRKLNECKEEIESYYVNLTGNPLWVVIAK